MNINDLRFVFFTNEKSTHLMELTLKYFFKHNTVGNVSVIVNNITTDDLPHKERVEYLNGKADFSSDGGHFAKSLRNTLPLINEEYVFLFMDDYFFAADSKTDQLRSVLDLMKCENIDYFGFEDMEDGYITPDKIFESNCSDIGKGNLFYKGNDYRYLYSLQPTIWKKSSLIEIVNKYPKLSAHEMDETEKEVKDENSLICLCNDLTSFVNDKDVSDYFCIAYYELIRHGVFHVPENGFALPPDAPYIKFIRKLIDGEGLINNNKFRKILHDIK